jgi:hypothetical protein
MKSTIEEALEKASQWADVDGVELVAQGQRDGRDCVVVHISREDAAASLPAEIGGYPVVVTLSGKVVAQGGRKDRGFSER